MHYANKVCDLECGKKPVCVHEFVGPVKIVLVESTAVDYQRKIWGSAAFTLATMLMGATVFAVFLFTLSFKLPLFVNLHVVLCTMGFHLFTTTGILMFSSLFGGSMHLTPDDRKVQHTILEIFGFLIGWAGILLMIEYQELTVHALTGFIGAILAVLSSVIGPTVYLTGPKKFGLFKKNAHRVFVIPTFILLTVCFVLGLMKASFIKWTPIKHLHYILIAFTVLYSAVTLVSIILRAMYGT
ncbi:hypothetical protein B5X24_HaOG203001 [Helicoverpa armigera]|uniref:Cytochrome b561 domain-containing protein n=1 Tax=Helicoverpa armigera TaxID=29058 RepID=A0A2W1BX35_HELAM|nr:hypothetical protein B5X24_HaOG203001 [Helicoverpa armigera]